VADDDLVASARCARGRRPLASLANRRFLIPCPPSTLGSGVFAAQVALLLVGRSAAQVPAAEQLDGGVNPDADIAHNPYIDVDVTKPVHVSGWLATETEDDGCSVTTSPCEINTIANPPYDFAVSSCRYRVISGFHCRFRTVSPPEWWFRIRHRSGHGRRACDIIAIPVPDRTISNASVPLRA
jgi:hypothetical protein